MVSATRQSTPLLSPCPLCAIVSGQRRFRSNATLGCFRKSKDNLFNGECHYLAQDEDLSRKASVICREAPKVLRCAWVVYNIALLGDTTPHIQHFSPIDFAMRRRPRLSPPFPLTDKLLRSQKCYSVHPEIPLYTLSNDKHRGRIRAGLRGAHTATEWAIDGVPMPTGHRAPHAGRMDRMCQVQVWTVRFSPACSSAQLQ